MGKDIIWINSNKRYYSTVSLRARSGEQSYHYIFSQVNRNIAPNERR